MDEQQQLVRAIFNQKSSSFHPSDFEKKGLEIYRRNLQANAVRALKISYPTVLKLVGDEVFVYAVEQLLTQDPPNTGDWGLWGEHFSKLLRYVSALQDFPYVADIARLDFALHLLGREKDVELDMSSMSLLGTCELDQLRVVLNPSIKILVSEFPISDIYSANHGLASEVELFLNQARQKLVAGSGQTVLLYRPQFKPLLRSVDTSEGAWLKLLQHGMSIGKALDTLTDAKHDFSLETWLPLAIQQNLILCLEKI